MSAPPAQPDAPASSTTIPFADDPRVSFDRISGRWHCEPLADSNDPLLEWDPDTNRWQPVLEDQLVRAQQDLYGLNPDQDTAPQSEKAADNQKRKEQKLEQRKKRKVDHAAADGATAGKSKLAPDVNLGQPSNKSSTSVYVSGLPLDATVEEVAQVFGRYGVLLEDEPGKPRIKFYHSSIIRPNNSNSSINEQGEQQQHEEVFKGEALVTFFKPESVELVISILDESCLRASLGQSTPLMHVTRADFSAGKKQHHPSTTAPHSNQMPTVVTTRPTANGKGANVDSPATASGAPAVPTSRKQLSEEEKKRIQKRNARLNE